MDALRYPEQVDHSFEEQVEPKLSFAGHLALVSGEDFDSLADTYADSDEEEF